jgi:ATP-binding cassette subfamily B protein
VLSGLSFEVPAGGTACIVGPSGVGKSTLLGLFVRLHDPSSGRVVVGGTDVRERSWGSLHDEVALVPQDSWLVAGSIAENIAYGAPDASEEEIRRAGTIALVSEFAERFPAGWATEVGEGGVRLSGGQRRRVALARAIVGGSRLLLLDEPTAGLDVGSKQAVIEAIGSVAEGRTVLIVTHDPQLAAIADKVVTLGLARGGIGNDL